MGTRVPHDLARHPVAPLHPGAVVIPTASVKRPDGASVLAPAVLGVVFIGMAGRAAFLLLSDGGIEWAFAAVAGLLCAMALLAFAAMRRKPRWDWHCPACGFVFDTPTTIPTRPPWLRAPCRCPDCGAPFDEPYVPRAGR
jgi:hypothetical protein